MASMNSSGPDLSFLNISDVDPKQNYNVVELNINGVMKKIMVPVVNSGSQERLSGRSDDRTDALNQVQPKTEPTPILIKPEEDCDLDDLGLQISNITSLSSFVHQPEKSSAAPVGRGRGQGRGRKMTTAEGIRRTPARGRGSRGRPSRGRGTRGRRTINARGFESNRKSTFQELNGLRDVLCAVMPENDNQWSTSSAGDNKSMLNSGHAQPELAARQAKLLFHFQQNADGSHVYKSFNILPSPAGKPLLAVPITTSSSTGVSTTVTQMTSKPSGMASMEMQNPLQSVTSQSIPAIINIAAGTSNNVVLLGVGQASVKGPQLHVAPGGVNIQMRTSSSTTSPMITQVSSSGSILQNTTNVATLNSTSLPSIISQIPPLPVLQNMQNIGSQGAVQVIQLGTAPVNGQPLKVGSPAFQQNVSCSQAVNSPLILRSYGQAPVLFGTDGKPVNMASQPVLKPAPVCQVGSDQHVVYKSVLAGCQAVTQTQSVPVICSQSSLAPVTKSTTSQSQQPTIVSGYFDSQNKFVIQQATVLPQGSPTQPIIIPSTSGATHVQVQKVSTSSSIHVAMKRTNGTAVKKSPEQLCRPLYLPPSSAQPTVASPCLPTLVASVASQSSSTSACTNQATVNQLLQKQGIQEGTNIGIKCESNLPQQSQNELCITQLLDLARGGVKKREPRMRKIPPSKDYVAITPASKEARSSQRTPTRARKRSPPPPSRRQTDVNIGRERKIFPKGTDTVPTVPLSVGVAPLYKSPGETASLMGLLPNSPHSNQQRDLAMKIEPEGDSAIANCSIVELMKQDLQLNDKSEKDDPTLHLESLMKLLKPCKVMLRRVDMKGQVSINLKHYRRCGLRFVRKHKTKVKIYQPAVDSELSCVSSEDDDLPQRRSGVVKRRGITKTKKRMRGKYRRKSKH